VRFARNLLIGQPEFVAQAHFDVLLNCMRLLLTLIVDFLLLTNGNACAVEAPKPRNGDKVIVVNDDGFSLFYSGAYKSEQDLRNKILSFSDTQVAVMEWGIMAGSRVNYASDVSELVGEGVETFPRRGDQLVAETLRGFSADGVDALTVVADACHEAGILCYASLRMNGDYAKNGHDNLLAKMFNSNFWWQHQDLRIHGANGEVQTALSYAFSDVRDFKLAILREIALRDIDGVNLDFQRNPDFFGFEESMLRMFRDKYGEDAKVDASDPRWELLRNEIMTAFVQDVRALLDEAGSLRGRHMGLSVRVDWKNYRSWGCDIEEWLKSGLLDYIVIGQRGLGGYEFDIAPFVEMARGTGTAVLFGEEAILSGHDTTAAEDRLIAEGKLKPLRRSKLTLKQYQARAVRQYAAGADGIHLFNEHDLKVMKVLGGVHVIQPVQK
jgi:hypothetical protein